MFAVALSLQVYEVVPCLSDCSQYVWVAEPWSVWKVSNVDLKENCGEGVQTRKVRYVILKHFLKVCYLDKILVTDYLFYMYVKVHAKHCGWAFRPCGGLSV